VCGGNFHTLDVDFTLIHRIAALHAVFQVNRPQTLWFGQLVAHCPETLISMKKNNNTCDKSEMVSITLHMLIKLKFGMKTLMHAANS